MTEMEADISIEASLEEVARAALQVVEICLIQTTSAASLCSAATK